LPTELWDNKFYFLIKWKYKWYIYIIKKTSLSM
jgi:hypothetical protein